MKWSPVLCLAVLAGCASAPKPAATAKAPPSQPTAQPAAQPSAKTPSAAAAPKVVTKASDTDRASLLDRVKGLEGEWLMQGEDGKWNVACVFKPIAAGSAVREIMFPGAPHEMTNLYHMDGTSLVMTHYCAAGNQPTMRAVARPGNAPLEFAPDSVANLTDVNEMYMGAMKLVLIDNDHAEQHWVHYKAGKVSGDPIVFTLVRKK